MNGLLLNLEQADKAATLALNSVHCQFTDYCWMTASDRKFWIPLYIILFGIMVRKIGWKKALIGLVTVALADLATDQLGNLIKNLVQRPRPCNDAWMLENHLRILERRGSKFGFYSAHSANAFGLATCILVILKQGKGSSKALAAFLFTWAAAVAISRIFVGKHYLGDITAGGIAGAVIGLVLGYMAVWITKKVSPSPSECPSSL